MLKRFLGLIAILALPTVLYAEEKSKGEPAGERIVWCDGNCGSWESISFPAEDSPEEIESDRRTTQGAGFIKSVQRRPPPGEQTPELYFLQWPGCSESRNESAVSQDVHTDSVDAVSARSRRAASRSSNRASRRACGVYDNPYGRNCSTSYDWQYELTNRPYRHYGGIRSYTRPHSTARELVDLVVDYSNLFQLY